MKEYTNPQIEKIIDDHIHNAMHRIVLKERFVDGFTYERIAEDVNRTPRQVGYIISKYACLLSKYLL